MKTADEIFALLGERRFAPPEYLWIGQVANGTGARSYRFMDGFALSLWPSRGIHVHAVEIKVDRRDWLREKATPEKAETIARFAHYMWLAIDGTARRPVLEDDYEVPPNWGILEVVERKGKPIVKTRRQATQLKPEAPTWGFFASVMRCADRADARRVESLVEDGIVKRAKLSKSSWETSYESLNSKYIELQGVVQKFEYASGLSIRHASEPQKLGEAVRQLLNSSSDDGAQQHLERALRHGEARCAAIRRALDEVSALEPQRGT